MNILRLLIIAFCFWSCQPSRTIVKSVSGDSPPPYVLGSFTDDYDVQYTISAESWKMAGAYVFHISSWDKEGQFLIAQNDPDNPDGGGQWTRIDYIPLEGMDPFSWAFCISAYDKPDAESARLVLVADRGQPRTGCNGFPFSRMKPIE